MGVPDKQTGVVGGAKFGEECLSLRHRTLTFRGKYEGEPPLLRAYNNGVRECMAKQPLRFFFFFYRSQGLDIARQIALSMRPGDKTTAIRLLTNKQTSVSDIVSPFFLFFLFLFFDLACLFHSYI